MTKTDNLNVQQTALIENIINNEFSSGLDARSWEFIICEGFGAQEYKDVLESLIKKELVVVMSWEDDPVDSVVYLTDSGKEIALQLFGEKYDWLR